MYTEEQIIDLQEDLSITGIARRVLNVEQLNDLLDMGFNCKKIYKTVKGKAIYRISDGTKSCTQQARDGDNISWWIRNGGKHD